LVLALGLSEASIEGFEVFRLTSVVAQALISPPRTFHNNLLPTNPKKKKLNQALAKALALSTFEYLQD
jgi:hypothetical protein